MTPEKREAIISDLRQDGANVSGLARIHGVSRTTVAVIKREVFGGQTAERTRQAVEDRRAQLASQRAVLSATFLQRAQEALAAMVSPTVIYNFGGKDNTYNEKEVDRPPTADQRNLMIIAATALDKHLVAERHDAMQNAGPVRGLLEATLDTLIVAYGPRPGRVEPGPDPGELAAK
jgi:transposase-like protein